MNGSSGRGADGHGAQPSWSGKKRLYTCLTATYAAAFIIEKRKYGSTD